MFDYHPAMNLFNPAGQVRISPDRDFFFVIFSSGRVRDFNAGP